MYKLTKHRTIKDLRDALDFLIENENENYLRLLDLNLCNSADLKDVFVGMLLNNTGIYSEFENEIGILTEEIIKIKEILFENKRNHALKEILKKSRKKYLHTKIHFQLLELRKKSKDILGESAYIYLLDLAVMSVYLKLIKFELTKEIYKNPILIFKVYLNF